MKFTLRSNYTWHNKFLKVINVCDLRIEVTGSGPEQGIGDTREYWIIYTTCEKPFKEIKINYDPELETLQIVTDKK